MYVKKCKWLITATLIASKYALLGMLGSSLGQVFLADKVRLSRVRLCVMGLIVSVEILKIIARYGCFGVTVARLQLSIIVDVPGLWLAR